MSREQAVLKIKEKVIPTLLNDLGVEFKPSYIRKTVLDKVIRKVASRFVESGSIKTHQELVEVLNELLQRPEYYELVKELEGVPVADIDSKKVVSVETELFNTLHDTALMGLQQKDDYTVDNVYDDVAVALMREYAVYGLTKKQARNIAVKFFNSHVMETNLKVTVQAKLKGDERKHETQISVLTDAVMNWIRVALKEFTEEFAVEAQGLVKGNPKEVYEEALDIVNSHFLGDIFNYIASVEDGGFSELQLIKKYESIKQSVVKKLRESHLLSKQEPKETVNDGVEYTVQHVRDDVALALVQGDLGYDLSLSQAKHFVQKVFENNHYESGFTQAVLYKQSGQVDLHTAFILQLRNVVVKGLEKNIKWFSGMFADKVSERAIVNKGDFKKSALEKIKSEFSHDVLDYILAVESLENGKPIDELENEIVTKVAKAVGLGHTVNGEEDSKMVNATAKQPVNGDILVFPIKKEREETHGIALYRSLVGELIKDDPIKLQFIKKDGSVRDMVATRSPKTHKVFDELNQKSEIQAELDGGYITVFEVGVGLRKFKPENLVYFILPNGLKVNVVGKTKAEEEAEKHFDPNKFDTLQLIEKLRKNVVRIVFEKSDGSTRIMYGTRNPKYTELYSVINFNKFKKEDEDVDSEEKIQAQIEKDYVKVFDLEAREWKTFKPSKLKRYDEEYGVSSWLEFVPEQDGWYDVMKGNKHPSEYYKAGMVKAKVSSVHSNKERIDFEEAQKREIEDYKIHLKAIQKQLEQAQSVNERRAERKKRWEESIRKINAVLKEKKFKVTHRDKEIYEKFYDLADNWETKLSFAQIDGVGRGNIEKIDVIEKLLLVSIRFDSGERLLLHPKFIFNGISHKIYHDRTGLLKFDDVDYNSELDAEFGHDIERDFVPLIRTRMKKDIFSEPLKHEKDFIRMKRVEKIFKDNEKDFERMGIRTKFAKTDSNAKLLIKVDSKLQFEANVNYFFDVTKGKLIFSREVHTATLREFSEAMTGKAMELGLSAQQFKAIYGSLYRAFDLREKNI